MERDQNLEHSPGPEHVGPELLRLSKHLRPYRIGYGVCLIAVASISPFLKSQFNLVGGSERLLTFGALTLAAVVGVAFATRARNVEVPLLPLFERGEKRLWIGAVLTILSTAANIFVVSYVASRFVGFLPNRTLGLWVIEAAPLAPLWFAWDRIAGSFAVRDAARNGALRSTTDRVSLKRLGIEVAIGAAIVFGIFAMSLQRRGESVGALEVAKLDGTKIALTSDKPIVLYAWAPWCGACKFQVAQMNDLIDQVDDEVVVGSVAFSAESIEEVNAYIDEHDVRFPVYVGTDALQRKLALNRFPTLMMIRDGELVWYQSGVTSAQHIEQVLRARL